MPARAHPPIAALALGWAGCAGGAFSAGASADGAGGADAGAHEDAGRVRTGPGGGGDGGQVVPAGSRYVYAHSGTTLYRLYPKTLMLEEVGEFGVEQNMIDLAVRADGALFTVSSGSAEAPGALWSVDPDRAWVTRLADVPGVLNVALTFLLDGTLLAADDEGEVRRIDPDTGEVTPVGRMGEGHSMAGDMVAVSDGTLYGVSDGKGAERDNLLVVQDPATGAVIEERGHIGRDRVFGIGFWAGALYVFTDAGELVSVDPDTGRGAEVATYPGIRFWGAGVTPKAPLLE